MKFEYIYIALSPYIGAVLAASVIYNVSLLKYSIETEKQFICTTKARFKFKENYDIDFSFPGGCLFAINDNFSYYFMRIHPFHRLNIYQSVSIKPINQSCPIKPKDTNQQPTEFYSKARALSKSVFRRHQIFYEVFTFSLFHAILIQVKFVWIDRRGA